MKIDKTIVFISLCIISFISIAFAGVSPLKDAIVNPISNPVRLSGNGIAWDDIRVPLVLTNAGTTKPAVLKVFRKDISGASQGVYTYAFEDKAVEVQEEELYFALQVPHSYKSGTALKPHLHWSVIDSTSSVSKDVRFNLEITCQDSSNNMPVTSISSITVTALAPYSVVYSTFSDITPGDPLSAMCVARITRASSDAADNFVNDVYGLEIDFHYQIDSFGSNTESTKL